MAHTEHTDSHLQSKIRFLNGSSRGVRLPDVNVISVQEPLTSDSAPVWTNTKNQTVSSLQISLAVASSTDPSMEGSITLWQFLLQLLADQRNKDLICWTSSDGEFKFQQPEAVAKLWGKKKNNPNMNYANMSRSLRFYYKKVRWSERFC